MPSLPQKVIPLRPRHALPVADLENPDIPRRRWGPISVALAASALIHLAAGLAIGRGAPPPVSVTLRPPTLVELSVVATREPPAQIATAEKKKPRPEAQVRAPQVQPRAVASPPQESAPVTLPAASPAAAEPPAQAAAGAPAAALSQPPAPLSRPADPAPPGAFAYAAYLHTPLPAYPPSARHQGQQGVVLARVRVGREGLPGEVRLAKSSGFEALDEAALEAVKGWRFAPARQGAEPVASWIEVPVRFRLEE